MGLLLWHALYLEAVSLIDQKPLPLGRKMHFFSILQMYSSTLNYRPTEGQQDRPTAHTLTCQFTTLCMR